MDAEGAGEEGSQAELVRQDVWMQSMVPSLPRRAAFVCLIFNIVVPGLGTITGGILSCCFGRPRLEFRPTKYRCPVAAIVIFVGFLQFIFTAFFLVGWLWSIIWGFLMLNLSDPKFRVMPKPPPPKQQSVFGTKPSIRVNKANYNYGNPNLKLPPGRKNFRRIITKARHHKEQALGLAPPLPADYGSSEIPAVARSLLSKIPVIKCSGGGGCSGPSKMFANAGSKFKGLFATRQCSSSRTVLLQPSAANRDGRQRRKSISVDSLSDRRTEPDSPSTLSNGRCDPIPSDAITDAMDNCGDSDKFNGLVLVTPASPSHSSTTSSSVVEELKTVASVENVKTLDVPVLEMATTAPDNTNEATLPVMEVKDEHKGVTETPTCDLNVPEISPEEPASVTRMTLDAAEDLTVKAPPPSESTIALTTDDAKIIGVESRMKSPWIAPNELRPKLKQSLTYHYDA